MSTNVDPQELKKFSELAHRWWDMEGEFKPLHDLNPLRLSWIQSHSPLAGQQVVDVGCGGGILSEAMARAGATVQGIDLAKRSLQVAQMHAIEGELTTVSYREIAAEDMAAEAPGRFDTVTCMEMLEHVPDPASIVRACAAMVKPGGWVFFSSINRNAKAWMLAIVGAEYVARLLPPGTHEYDKLVRPSELARYCREAGLSVQDTQGVFYNPLTQRFRLMKDTSVNYMLAARKGLDA